MFTATTISFIIAEKLLKDQCQDHIFTIFHYLFLQATLLVNDKSHTKNFTLKKTEQHYNMYTKYSFIGTNNFP